MPDASPRLLVIRRRYLGDIVLLGSLLRNLRLHWPSAHIAVLTEPAYAAVLALNPDVDAALTLPARALAWPAFLRQLRSARFTHVFDVDNTDKTAALTRLTGAPFRATLHLDGVRRHFPSVYTATAFVSATDYSAQPITETYLRLLTPAGVPVATREVRLVPREEDLAKTSPLLGTQLSTLNSQPARRLLLHPGSRSAFRLWPAENFAAVCDRLQDELGAQVFLVGGPGEQKLLAEIKARAKTHVVAFERSFTVGQFAALTAQCDALLCHDSGPMHVAAAVGTRVVALFGSQNTTVWRPVGDAHTVLQAALPCGSACVAPTECVREDSYRSYCVRRLSVAEVFAALRSVLTDKFTRPTP